MLYQFVLEVKHVTVSLTKKKTKKKVFQPKFAHAYSVSYPTFAYYREYYI